ncbi:MAG TPA: asparagine synthase (glutamine-hydrolyzing) [Chitinophagales bacterium]|nr:asparagine synthase (glutamine-hydrolyzing) [Chitinophagales bacterium]
MCGITGYYSTSKKTGEADLKRMTDRLAHRGPDAAGYYFNDDKTIGLGHRRLSIIDLSEAANQPFYSQSGRYVTVFNGEVYNYQEIAAQLNIKQRTTSDTEIIIEAFEKKGVEFVHLLNGMFAIAIYDKQEHKLYLFRDRLGVKPLYYYNDAKNLAFASEIKALLQADVIGREAKPDPKTIYSFLYSGYVPEPFTAFTNILRLPAGSYAVVDAAGITITSYWKPEEKVTTQVVTDFATAKQQLKDLLVSSVKYRMIADVPFGTFLSGGIDSSTVTAVAQSISAKPVKTFSIGFKESKFNESKYARQVSEHLGTEHYEFIVTESDALQLMDRMLNEYDDLYSESSGIPTMLVSKLARQHVTMTLSGDGGDELFLGYGSYDWAKRLNNPLVKLLRKPAAAVLATMGSRYKRAAGVLNYKSEAHLKSHIFSQEEYYFSEHELAALLKPQYSSPLLFNEDMPVARTLSPAEEQALFDIKYYLKDTLLTKVDIASMQFSLETRTPFLDYRVVEFALNLAGDLKKKDGTAKYLLKEVLYDYVPKQFFDRPKWGFSIPLGKWLLNDLYYLIERYLSEETVTACNVVNYSVVKDLLVRFKNGEDYLFKRVWILIILHHWLLKHHQPA